MEQAFAINIYAYLTGLYFLFLFNIESSLRICYILMQYCKFCAKENYWMPLPLSNFASQVNFAIIF